MSQSSTDSRELPTDRLATSDVDGTRIYLYPADVRGRFRNWRARVRGILIVIFLVMPWIRIGGEQSLLLDIVHGRFQILGFHFWAHDIPAVVLVAGIAIFSIAFVTSIWGRAWCGWACPQTVFIEGVFRKIERWIEGDGVERRRLDESPLDSRKLLIKSAKWALFIAVGLVISHSFLAYFVGTEALARMVRSSPAENTGTFLAMIGMTAIVLFDFGWFREQFCTVVCPYGRFQSVLMDDQSLTVAYDSNRGEPRKAGGDCVNCYRCVQVCPTGIDIRRGLQLECIACTACIDACDEVMTRIKKPVGLIRYHSAKKGIPVRSIFLGLILIVLASALSFLVIGREPLELAIIRASEAPYQEIPTAGSVEIVNHFKLDIRNQEMKDVELSIGVSATDRLRGTSLIVSNLSSKMAPGQSQRGDAFIRFPKLVLSQGRGQARITVTLVEANGETRTLEREVPLVGPLK